MIATLHSHQQYMGVHLFHILSDTYFWHFLILALLNVKYLFKSSAQFLTRLFFVTDFQKFLIIMDTNPLSDTCCE